MCLFTLYSIYNEYIHLIPKQKQFTFETVDGLHFLCIKMQLYHLYDNFIVHLNINLSEIAVAVYFCSLEDLQTQ